jgi:hypothetical protein
VASFALHSERIAEQRRCGAALPEKHAIRAKKGRIENEKAVRMVISNSGAVKAFVF